MLVSMMPQSLVRLSQYLPLSPGAIQNTSFALSGGLQNLTESASYVLDQITVPPATGFNTAAVPSLSMLVVSQGSSILADRSTYPVQLGNLALSAEVPNQTWVNGSELVNGTMITNYLYVVGQIPSNLYGLHISSA